MGLIKFVIIPAIKRTMKLLIKFCLLSYAIFSLNKVNAQITPYEASNKVATTTYAEAIKYYESLAKSYPKQSKLYTYGKTDFGKPLHLLVLSKDGILDPLAVKKANKRVLLINNGIHPGEPEGIDASMMLARDLLKGNKLPSDVVIAIIPIYNIDGSHNRTSTSRANQNGPVEYGFRGNGRNYDLNRDFIKSDSQNSKAFQLIFNTWQPEVFVDTHTSNGSDYQYTMTLIPTQKDKLNKELSAYISKTMVPDLYKSMAKKGYDMVPYVNSISNSPDAGISGFMESPRYSTGYAALHNALSFMPETHMLKSFDKRVDATYKLLESYVEITQRDAKIIGENKAKADADVAKQVNFPLEFKLNRSTFDTITFHGFNAKQKPSDVSGLSRLYYDRNDPFTRTIRFYDKYEPVASVNKPIAYIIPQAWENVIELFKLNRVKMQRLSQNTTIEVEMYYIVDYKTAPRPYEGHYNHSAVKLDTVVQKIKFFEGDYVVYVNQPTNRYIVETLEPQGIDSYFNWNFFDSVLSQKEHFSAYIFEDTAAELLKKDPELKAKFESAKAADPEMQKSAQAQLNFIYKNSDYYEPTFNRYPIGRLVKNVPLNLK